MTEARYVSYSKCYKPKENAIPFHWRQTQKPIAQNSKTRINYTKFFRNHSENRYRNRSQRGIVWQRPPFDSQKVFSSHLYMPSFSAKKERARVSASSSLLG